MSFIWLLSADFWPKSDQRQGKHLSNKVNPQSTEKVETKNLLKWTKIDQIAIKETNMTKLKKKIVLQFLNEKFIRDSKMGVNFKMALSKLDWIFHCCNTIDDLLYYKGCEKISN